jgi:hypothetical protein
VVGLLEKQMRALRLGQRLAIALSLTLLIVGAIGLGAGIQHGDIQPPDLNITLSGLHIVAYTTDPIECRPYLACQGLYRAYYEIWVFRQTAPDSVPENGHRILSVPLQHRFNFTRVDHP